MKLLMPATVSPAHSPRHLALTRVDPPIVPLTAVDLQLTTPAGVDAALDPIQRHRGSNQKTVTP